MSSKNVLLTEIRHKHILFSGGESRKNKDKDYGNVEK